MKKDLLKRAAFAVLAAVMLLSMTACGTNTDTAAEEENSEDVLTDTAMELLTQGGHSDTSGKEETVYVIADAEGTPGDIIDTVHLKNGDASDELTDVANLTDIENTKGDETYTDNGDGTITWNAGGSDIYYEGHSDAALPLNVSISYTLDGKPVTAEELAGQSGHLAITFAYDNTMTKEVEIDGQTLEISRPCAVVSGVLLDNNTCSNVTVTNGKAISDGDNLVAVGMAMPGLSESLGLDTLDTSDLDVDIDTEEIDELLPDSVTIEADVTDFSLDMTLTAVSWDIMDSLDLSRLEETADTASSSAADLQSGTDDLIDGAEEINSYLNELSDGTGDLADGAKELATGTASARDGIDELNDGLAEMQTQVSSLPDGAAKLLAGAQALSAALQSGNTDVPGVYEAVLMMKDGADAIASGTSGIMSGAQALAGYSSTIASSLYSGDESNPGIYEAASQVKSGLAAAVSGLSTSLGSAAAGTQSALDAEGAAESYLESVAGMASGEMSTAIQTAIAYIQGAEYADGQVLNGLNSASVDLTAANAALDSIMSGAQTLAGYASTISSKMVSGDYETNPGIYEAAYLLNQGAQDLSSNAAYLASVIATMNNDDNLGALIAGLQELCGSSDTLVSGVNQLASGSSQLASGMDTLSDGADEVADGAETVDSAAGSLAEGSETLLEGINTLNDEGIAKIVDLLDGDVSGLYDRLEALQAFGSESMTFAGAADGIDCSTVYIYKTASIG